jgi:transcription antitermination protein NusB
LSRRLARDVAFRALFQADIGKCRAELALRHSLAEFSFSPKEEQFIRELVTGVIDKQDHLDQFIKKHLVNWEIDRLSAVDRNLLRLALFEILFRQDIPHAVSINEALELAKKYGGTGEAVGFINGVLDRAIGETLERES